MSQSRIDQDALRGCFQMLHNLLKENLELLETFSEMFKKCNELDQFIDLYEAMNYELKIRCSEAMSLISSVPIITTSTQQQTAPSTEIRNIITDEQKEKKQKIDNLEPNQFYDWILDINVSQINSCGWKLYMNEQNTLKGANLAVVGLYDKGKTHILNKLTNQHLPTGQKITTKGLSFKNSKIDGSCNIVVVDTPGNYAPESMKNMREKEQSENLIQDIVFELGDYFICVVNDFTSIEIRYLDELTRKLKESLKSFKEIIVIHNLKDTTSAEMLEHVWEIQIQKILEGNIQKSKVEATSPFSQLLEEKSVLWFKTQWSRHLCIVNDESDLGKSINPWTYSLLKYWLKGVVVPHNKQITPNDLLSVCESRLTQLFKRQTKLEMIDTHSIKEKRIIRTQTLTPKLEVSLEMPEEEFTPNIDIIQGNQYIVLIDLPGMALDEVEIYRQNVTTIVRGYRKWFLYNSKSVYLRNERKHGHFELKFKIPTEYDRKWSYFGMNNGVLGVIYDLDIDERPIIKK